MKRKFLVLSISLCVLVSCLFASNDVLAVGNDFYYIKSQKGKFEGKKGEVKFSYELPQLKGNNKEIKKINDSLKKNYVATKKKAILEAKKYDCDTERVYYKVQAYLSYNDKGYVSFMFTEVWGGQHDIFENNILGVVYSVNTGKKLTIADVLSLNVSKAKNKVANAYVKNYK